MERRARWSKIIHPVENHIWRRMSPFSLNSFRFNGPKLVEIGVGRRMRIVPDGKFRGIFFPLFRTVAMVKMWRQRPRWCFAITRWVTAARGHVIINRENMWIYHIIIYVVKQAQPEVIALERFVDLVLAPHRGEATTTARSTGAEDSDQTRRFYCTFMFWF